MTFLHKRQPKHFVDITVDIVPEITETAEAYPMPTATKTLWFHRDHLGTPRAVTNENGDVESLHDYTPFGIELPIIQPPRPDGHPYNWLNYYYEE